MDWQDPSHNMCSSKNNKPDATCSAAGGPESIESCPGWFKALWNEQKEPWTLVKIGLKSFGKPIGGIFFSLTKLTEVEHWVCCRKNLSMAGRA